jgi:pyruvyl transferase EpsI
MLNNSNIMNIKNIISFKNKFRILLFLQQFKSFRFFDKNQLQESKNKVYIFLAADYGNLGDVAITFAQTKFLEENLKDLQVVEIPISQSLEGLWFVKRHIKKGDIITTVGGGNLGNLYDQIEFIRQLVVSFYPNNKFISFPQTFDFDTTAEGQKSLSIAKRVYNSHSNIVFVAREETSYSMMQKHFTAAKVILTPDIVISLDKQESFNKREGVVICMRKDKEKNLSAKQSQFINEQIKNRFENISFYDTHINRDQLSISERESELNAIWNAFRSAELVVTDRLHGMIFCYITNTPCLVFQNNNHKVRETYDWIKGNLNINLVTEFSEENIEKFFKRKDFNTGELVAIREKYQPLINLLK